MRLTSEGLFIKISGVTSEADALFSIGLGATAVGFDFALTPRQISVSAAHDIVRRLPQGALSVGVFRAELPQRVVEIANTLGLSAVQIDGPASTDEVSYIAERVNTVLRMVPDGTERLGVVSGVDYLVLPEADEPEALADSLELFSTATNVSRSSPRAVLTRRAWWTWCRTFRSSASTCEAGWRVRRG